MGFHIHNTLTRHTEPFEPLVRGKVSLYTCGPTVYDYAHIGNFRAYVFEDLLRRYLAFSGFDVKHVMNLTDVDDKTIRACREQGVPLKTFTQTYVDAFFDDLGILNIQRADVYPAATDHVGEMIGLIKKLFDKGYAYQSDDGSVYFNIARCKDYGKLAHIDQENLRPGTRVAHDEYEKENIGDFALWKAWDEDDGEVAWDSPWGRGRPGWHIECSAMSMKHLGETIDIHCGGMDNIFPHHEDEIAQSECATGQTFVRYWMHCAHLIVDGKKMSKSLGNFHALRDLLERGYTGRELRYELIATHYRQTLNFTFESLDAARAALRRIDEFLDRLQELAAGADDGGELPDWAGETREKFSKALDDDLNVSEALAAVFDTLHAGNKGMDDGKVSPVEAKKVLALFDDLDRVLGVLKGSKDEAAPEVMVLVAKREEARKAKNWADADRYRDELQASGWTVKDTPQGPKLSRV